MLGLSLSAFTTLHLVLSLVGIAAGFAVVPGLLGGKRQDGMTLLFLVATALTSVTGFMFPFSSVLPSHIVGAISLVVLAAAVVALYGFRLSGPWRWVYVVGAMMALYLNTFVGVVQAFQKIPALKALAPTQAELPFVVAQVALLVAFLAVGGLGVRRFRPSGA